MSIYVKEIKKFTKCVEESWKCWAQLWMVLSHISKVDVILIVYLEYSNCLNTYEHAAYR